AVDGGSAVEFGNGGGSPDSKRRLLSFPF
ncbi:hypothetical protein A2U01_0067476, partial [Trifolium medium]|nr:hypothetical protein [Trifolium medium]